MGQKENRSLPLNPDGSPDLRRVTKDNIRFGLPEDQHEELAKLHEPVSQNLGLNLDTKMSRRTLLYSVPLSIIGTALLKNKVSDTFDGFIEDIAGSDNYTPSETAYQNSTPEPAFTTTPAGSPEKGENMEVPFPYQIDGWTLIVKKKDIDSFRGELFGKNKHWTSAKVSIAHLIPNLGEEFYIDQNSSPGISLLNNEMFMSDEERESLNVFYKDGTYRLPTAPVSENTFLKIETKNIGDEGRQVDMYPIELKTGTVLDRLGGINPKLTYNNFEVVFENNPYDSMRPEDLYMHGLCLNAISPLPVRKVIVPGENDRSFMPTFPVTKKGMYLTVPETIAKAKSSYPANEHPALIRMTRDFTAKICKNPDPVHGAGIQTILTSLESYILENRLQILPQGTDNVKLMDTLSIKTIKLYDVNSAVFDQTETVTPKSDTIHAQDTLANLVPVLWHKSSDFERAYDDLSEELKMKADTILLHALSLLYNNVPEDKFHTAFPSAKEILEKRGISKIPTPTDLARGKFANN